MLNELMSKAQFYGNNVKIIAKKSSLLAFLIEGPEKNLPNDVKMEIFDEFYPVAISAFGQVNSPHFSEDVYKHLFNVGFLVLIFDCENDRNAGIAFRTCTLLNYKQSKILYIEGTAIKVEYQGLGIYQSLTKELAKNVDFVASRTQNPVVVTALSRLFKNVYPVTAKPDDVIKSIAWCVSDYLKMSNYECDYMIGRKTYGGIITGTLPSAGDGIDKAVLELINPEAGDCLIVICPV